MLPNFVRLIPYCTSHTDVQINCFRFCSIRIILDYILRIFYPLVTPLIYIGARWTFQLGTRNPRSPLEGLNRGFHDSGEQHKNHRSYVQREREREREMLIIIVFSIKKIFSIRLKDNESFSLCLLIFSISLFRLKDTHFRFVCCAKIFSRK